MARTIQLKTTKAGTADKPEFNLNYIDQIILILQQPQDSGGVTMDEILKVSPVLAKANHVLEMGMTVLTLEDAEYEILMARLATFRFGMVHTVIIDFIKAVQGAKSFEPVAVEEA